MKVRELIEKLAQADPDAVCVVYDEGNDIHFLMSDESPFVQTGIKACHRVFCDGTVKGADTVIIF